VGAFRLVATRHEARGRAEGAAHARAETTLWMLDLRHVPAPTKARDRIPTCAILATTTEDLFTNHAHAAYPGTHPAERTTQRRPGGHPPGLRSRRHRRREH
jgi:hypothetical protein